MLIHRCRRVFEVLASPLYRRVLWSRILCSLLKRLNPNLVYLGLRDEQQLTWLFLKDNVVTPYTIAGGSFQGEDVLAALSLSQNFRAKNQGVFLDVGANIGTTTLYALRTNQFRKALCIEPSPVNQEILSLNLRCNGYSDDKATILKVAVSNEVGKATLSLSSANCGDHRLKGSPTSFGGKMIEVDVKTLDAILSEQGIPPDDVSLAWIDTQGHEGFVLQGAQQLMKAGVPFCIEFWPQALIDAGCYESLLSTIEKNFSSFVDLGTKDRNEKIPATKIRDFAKKFEGSIYHTDLFLTPS